MAAAFVTLDERGRAERRLALHVASPRRPPPPEKPRYYPEQPLKRRVMFAAEPIARSLHRQLFPLLVRRARSDGA